MRKLIIKSFIPISVVCCIMQKTMQLAEKNRIRRTRWKISRCLAGVLLNIPANGWLLRNDVVISWLCVDPGLLTPEQCRSKRQRKLLKQQQQQGSPQGLSSTSPLNYPSSVKSEQDNGGGGSSGTASNFDYNLGGGNSSHTGQHNSSSSLNPSQGNTISGYSSSSSSSSATPPNAPASSSIAMTSNFGSLAEFNDLNGGSRGGGYYLFILSFMCCKDWDLSRISQQELEF